MLLSIGMIVKNEEKYLRHCLEALTPILKQVKSELIIVDTGSNDSTVEIAKEFTKNVFHFDWCNDFAAARNAALKRATGIWYMSIDADEILEDPKELINFFNYGEYKKFNSAAYVIKSANEISEINSGVEFNALRLIKRNADSHYISAVHECFAQVDSPIKFLTVVANHYGYIIENDKDYIEYKTKRNLEIMFGQLKENPSDSILYLNICHAYAMIRDYKKALEYCDKGFACTNKEDDLNKYLFYSSCIAINFQLENYLKVIDIANEYFSSKQIELGTDLEMYYFKAKSCVQLKKHKEAIISFKNYLIFYVQFKQGQHNTYDTLQHAVNFANDVSYRSGVLALVESLIEEKDYISAKSYLQSIPYADFLKDKDNIPYWLRLEIDLMEKLNDFSGITTLYEQLDSTSLDIMHELIEQKIANEVCRNLILKEFVVCQDSSIPYYRLMNLRYNYDNGTLTEEAVHDFISDIEEWIPLYADAIYMAVDAGLPLQYIASKIDSSDLGRFFYNNACYHFSDLPYLVYRICQNNTNTLDTNTQIWLSSLYILELSSDHLREEQASDLFMAYAKTAFSGITAIFKEELLLDENAYLLPKLFRVGYYCHMAESSLEMEQNTQYIKYLKIALKLYPPLNKVIKILTTELENKLNEKASRLSQFQAYAVEAKKAIATMINNGQTNEALQFINEYESICPLDQELSELKKQILARQA